MGIKPVRYPPYSPDLGPCDFCLFPKLRDCRYERIEEMKDSVTKVIDTLTQEEFHGAFQKLLERYNKCIATGGDYFEGYESFICLLSIKVPTQKSLETYLMTLVFLSCQNQQPKNSITIYLPVLRWIYFHFLISEFWKVYLMKKPNLKVDVRG